MAEKISRVSVYHHESASGTKVQTSRAASLPRLLVVRAVRNDFGEVGERFNRMVDNLQRVGWNARVCFSSLPALIAEQSGKRVRTSRIRFMRNLYRQIGGSDIVQIIWDSHHSFITDVLPTLLLGRFQGKRIVLRCTGDSIEQTLERWGKIIAPTLRTIDSIVVSSRYMVDTLARYGLVATAIPPIVDTAVPPRLIRTVQPKLLCMRPLEPDMNVACVIRAYSLVKQKYPRTELIVAGDGPQRQELEQAVADQGLSGVAFVGAVDEAGRRELMQSADIFLNGSSRDDLPSVLLEAMAAGLPVVTTDAGGIPELVGDHQTGLVAAINDHVGLADAVIDLVEDSQLTESLSKAGRAEAELYSWTRLRHRWLTLYTRQAPAA
jgi:glycosyltransferase involved in cell wall biosynthesis